jgi:hypothetical protein
VNRGYNSVIEAAVHGTRWLWKKDPELWHLIDHHRGIIRKCGGPKEIEALEMLEGYLKVSNSSTQEREPAGTWEMKGK